jgi:hypothetical protein
MFFLFSRPIEFPGIFAFYYSLIGFTVLAIASEILRRVIFRAKNEPALESPARSWLAGFALLGFVFLIGNLILAVPAIAILFFIHIAVIERSFDASDRTFHQFDNVVTALVLAFNLFGYVLAVRLYHRKIYLWFRREKKN